MNVIVLEHPRLPSEEKFNEIANTPLWSCLMGGYAASSLLKAGHDVCFIDTTKNGWDFQRTAREILTMAPELLGVNAVYFWEHTGRLFSFFDDLRTAGFSGHITLFGFFPTLAAQAILGNNSTVDSVLVGECEDTLCELADGIANGEVWHNLPGVAARSRRGDIRMAGCRAPRIDPDRFPFPQRADRAGTDETVSILASRGCYNQCAFCPVPAFYGQGPRWCGRTPENVYREMTILRDQGFQDFYFVDPNFIGPGRQGQARAAVLLDLIRPLEITFGMETRPNDLNREILDRLLSAGFNRLLLGVESGSASVLRNLNKGAAPDAGAHAIQICREAGIEPEIGFLMFVPDSTLEDLQHNMHFLQENALLDRLAGTANLLGHSQIVLMGTSGYRMYEQQGRLIPQGVFGFEGSVRYQDERVLWLARLMTQACRTTLRHMSRPESPVYWRTSETGVAPPPEAERLNDYLVSLFNELLQDISRAGTAPPADDLNEKIEEEILHQIYPSRTGLHGSSQEMRVAHET